MTSFVGRERELAEVGGAAGRPPAGDADRRGRLGQDPPGAGGGARDAGRGVPGRGLAGELAAAGRPGAGAPGGGRGRWACASSRAARCSATLADALRRQARCCWCWTTASTCSTPAPPGGRAAAAPAPTCASWPPAARRCGVAGEVAWRVPSLALPDAADAATAGAELARYEAVRLFVERARAVAAGLRAHRARTRAAVAEICRRLDGIPLALELAAARVRALPVEQIAAAAGRPLPAADRRRPDRAAAAADAAGARSTGATTCSTEPERACSAGWRSSPAAGRWRRPRRSAPGTAETRRRARPALAAGGQVAGAGGGDRAGAARYRLLETVRQYAGEKLREYGEATRVLTGTSPSSSRWPTKPSRRLAGPLEALWVRAAGGRARQPAGRALGPRPGGRRARLSVRRLSAIPVRPGATSGRVSGGSSWHSPAAGPRRHG